MAVKGADVKSFLTIETDRGIYGKDKNNVYYENLIIPGADPKTFKYIKDGYSIDKNKAYYNKDSSKTQAQNNLKLLMAISQKTLKMFILLQNH